MNKRLSTKTITKQRVWGDSSWVVHFGVLKRGVGHPGKIPNLFTCVAEKVPLSALEDVAREVHAQGITATGVYVAHDSMGCPRYAGRGNIFGRLRAHRSAHPDELAYFSFYVVKEKKHEREIETLVIRSAGFLLEFNDKKKRVGVAPGNVGDYEAGTHFFERQRKKGKKRKGGTK